MKPVILFRKDNTTGDEFSIAKRYFATTEQRNGIHNSLVIGRYSVLPFYKELEKDLEINNSRLINSYNQYNWVANFDWYEDLKDYTFKSYFNAYELDDNKQYVVKGRTNSRKQNWDKLMFAENKKRAIEIMIELNNDSLIGTQGVVFREYCPLVTYEIGINGLRFTNEWRFFMYKTNILSYAYYWSLAGNIPVDIDPEAINLVNKISEICAENTNFYVLDIAQKESGEWVLVEVNDGQMSGLSENNPDKLYSNLYKFVH